VIRRLLLAALALALGACATAPPNAPLARYDAAAGYRYDTLAADGNGDDLFVILTFSGGGTRAAAFSFGVMEGLRDAVYHAGGSDRRLLQDVDVISSVSGGSFTAAYYALFPDTFFAAFPDAFLYRDIQGELLGRALRPWNWFRLGQRIRLALELYDETVFQSKTFADLQRKPYLILNATDMTLGRRFEFTQEQFDLLCSDVTATPIAAGVAASSAFPGLLSPLTLENFAGRGCGFTKPEWLDAALDREHNPLERYARARDLWSYQDPGQQRRYVHLLDGGLADNIGLRGPYAALRSSTDVEWSVLRRVNAGSVQRVLVVTANAKTKHRHDWDAHAGAPGLLSVLGFVASGPMDNYSFDTVNLVREFFREQTQEYDAWQSCRATLKDACPAAAPEPVLPPIDYHAVEVSFEGANPRVQRCLEELPTSFALDRAQVDLLRQAGRTILLASRDFGRAMRAIDPAWQPPAAVIDPNVVDAACPPPAAGVQP
jgi:NTE family protein